VIIMFNSYEFTFAGVSSKAFGLMIYDIGNNAQEDVSFGNIAEIEQERIPRMVHPIHYGVNYHAKPLEFSLVFGAQDPLNRYEMEEIAYWLTGYQDYQWMTLGQEDLLHCQFRCLVKELTPITVGWLPYAFKAKIVCDCPYAYSEEKTQSFTISGETTVFVQNDGYVREYVKPVIEYELSSGNSISIVNQSDGGRTFTLTNIPSGSSRIQIDSGKCMLTDKSVGKNLYANSNLKFPRLVTGDNSLKVTGNGTMTVKYRCFYNVAG